MKVLFCVLLLVSSIVADQPDSPDEWDWLNGGLEALGDDWSLPGGFTVASSKSSSSASKGSSATASSKAIAKDGGAAESTSTAIAEGQANANATTSAEAEGDEQAFADGTAIANATGDGNGIADASVLVNSTGGIAEGTAIAFAETLSEVKTAVAAAINVAIVMAQNPLRKETYKAIATAEAVAIADITVKAYAEAGVVLSVEGTGFAEGSAEAFAEDVDQTVAQALADAFALATNDFSDAESSAYAESVVVAIAKARASAKAIARTYGGDAIAFQQSLAKVIAQALAGAIARGMTLVFGADAYADSISFSNTNVRGNSDVKADSDTSVVGVSFADADGDALAGFGEVPECKSTALNCCRMLESDRFKDAKSCQCTRSGRWCRFTLVENSAGLKTWEDRRTKELCYCPNLLPF